jgi:CIC family chloride channel protein
MIAARDPSPQPNLDGPVAGFSPGFWVLTVAIGVGVGLAGGGLMLLLQAVERLAWGPGGGRDLLAAVQHTGPGRRVLCLTVAGAWVGLGGLTLRRVFGSKGGEVDSAIWFRSGRVAAIPTVARSVLSIVAVGLGMSLGREAPVKSAGGAVASWLAGWADVPPAHRRLLVASGVGAGMAAAYNVPLGGAMFALEVLLGTLSLRLVLPAVAMSVAAVATSWLFLPTGPVYTFYGPRLTPAITVWSLVAGPAFGVIAVGLVRLVAWAGSVRLRGATAVLVPIVVLTLLGVAAIGLPQLLGNGLESVQLALDGKLGLGLLLALPLLKGVATAACMGAGARGGLFTPTLMIGATVGGLLGHAWAVVWPGGVDPGLAALIGGAAVLSAATRGPVSSVVMILELTRHGDATMVPILLAVTGATLTAGRLEQRSLYSYRAGRPSPTVALPTWPGVEWTPNPAVVSAAAGYPAVVRLLLATTAPVYVVDDDGRLAGTIGPTDVDTSGPFPINGTTAGDLARPVDPLATDADAAVAVQRLSVDRCAPVVTADDGRFVGVARSSGRP